MVEMENAFPSASPLGKDETSVPARDGTGDERFVIFGERWDGEKLEPWECRADDEDTTPGGRF
ncbi:hypothetical protein PGT21_023373 [Puccinia graminis f. sp. tritici]|uniref:Uncharacterized protein n=2 Tax=Puccinia graminis f. sp. tritici TaxID=56615 RepID=H6QP29_PUCGT|nr:uncharacterized protein PGTG_20728 [Puccinia graminis f. sp. tritici CRL 75-36-700-3]EHS63143.1 hypothetical protein PGTG_20728 [Puccinia graminis f. sp. tritici CRL 75-36-700-3]KAA1099869.1 hypothetical protein PGT21_023373 [Puccinia graminis f. sp. tritici]KAA1123513.1 hypothetical protein PGTUg99_023015 [Puccinia graminis f. sp. tritici]